MTEQKAIKMLEHSIVSYETQNRNNITCDLTQEVLDMAIEALEKQIPKKPINKKVSIYSGRTQILYADCPICGQPVNIFNGHQNNKEFRRDEDVFCSYCGQHFDWSE